MKRGPLRVRSSWSAEQTRSLGREVLALRRRRFVVRSAVGVTCVAALLAFFLRSPHVEPVRPVANQPVSSAQVATDAVHYADGSIAELGQGGGVVHLDQQSAELVSSTVVPNPTLPGEVGIGHALGLVHMSGTSDSASATAGSVSGVWAAPFLFGACEAQLGQPLFLQFGAQLGVVTVPVRGYVARDSDVGAVGFWGGLSLGIGLNL